MYHQNYKFKSKDFFYIQRLPLYLSIPLFIAASIALLFIASIFISMLLNPFHDQQAKSLIVLMGIIYLEYLLFYFLFCVRQAVGVQGIFNRKKGLLPWDQILAIHIASAPCNKGEESFKPAHQGVFSIIIAALSKSTLHTNGFGIIGGAFLDSRTKLAILRRKIIFHVKDLDYSHKSLKDLWKADFLCGNLVFEIDLPILELKQDELIERMHTYLKQHPDWAGVTAKFK